MHLFVPGRAREQARRLAIPQINPAKLRLLMSACVCLALHLSSRIL